MSQLNKGYQSMLREFHNPSYEINVVSRFNCVQEFCIKISDHTMRSIIKMKRSKCWCKNLEYNWIQKQQALNKRHHSYIKSSMCWSWIFSWLSVSPHFLQVIDLMVPGHYCDPHCLARCLEDLWCELTIFSKSMHSSDELKWVRGVEWGSRFSFLASGLGSKNLGESVYF